MDMFKLEDNNLADMEDSHLYSLMYGVEPNITASISVTRKENKLHATVTDMFGNQRSIESDSEQAWDEKNDIISLLPLPNTQKNVHLPGLGACMNILPRVNDIVSENTEVMDERHIDALITPQERSGTDDGFVYSGAYRSNVERNRDVIPAYRNRGRDIFWLGKKISSRRTECRRACSKISIRNNRRRSYSGTWARLFVSQTRGTGCSFRGFNSGGWSC